MIFFDDVEDSEGFLEFIKERKWYKENLKIYEVVRLNNEKMSLLNESIKIYDKLIDLCSRIGKDDEIEQHKKDQKDDKKILKFREKLILLLKDVDVDLNDNIQNVIN